MKERGKGEEKRSDSYSMSLHVYIVNLHRKTTQMHTNKQCLYR